jgi:hypothetical protein
VHHRENTELGIKAMDLRSLNCRMESFSNIFSIEILHTNNNNNNNNNDRKERRRKNERKKEGEKIKKEH